ncbi:sodium/hydrogen exchanger 9B1 isoform X2 [Cavia porcellus]|uniref:sodium/hydrogen exchanger 9B1 isoform X2 n=2 Tax=Cavia porcellus TaxID=10141 RepID=UPI002FE3E507
MSISSMHSMHTTNSESKDEYRSVRSSTSSQTFRDPVNGSRKGTKETVLLNSEETIPQTKQRIYFSCPPQGLLNKVMTNGNEVLPNGSLFGLVIIFYSACVGGILLQLIRIPPVPPLPPLLGMLLAGFIIRNIPSIAKHVKVPTWWSSTLRSTALTVILIRAGLGLDPKVLQQMKTVCFRLSFGPCLVEACSAAVFSHFIMDFPWQWGFLLGFVLGAVSPAVVVPSMLRLQEAGYGAEKGIPTLLVAASSMDDIVAITGFNTFLNLIFSKGSVLHNILSTVWDVLVGVLIGIVFGVFIQYFPSEDQEKVPMKRAFLILSMSISAVLGSQYIGLHGAGGLFTLVLSFTAGLKWATEKTRVQKLITSAWNFFEPLLFGLVGSEVSVSSLKSNAIGTCVITLCLGVLFRILSTFALMCFAGFSFKEKIFIALSWMPKATVQAVLGPLALETARLTAPHLESYAKDVMTVAFLAILVTAPNGALFIGILGPRFLTRHWDPSKVKLHLPALEGH